MPAVQLLAPVASVNFTGSYAATLICCNMTETLTVRGQDRWHAFS
jgi:hypothetical protein